MPTRTTALLFPIILPLLFIRPAPAAPTTQPIPESGRWKLVEKFDAPEANQAAASDGKCFYAINDAQIGKYDRATGKRLALSTGEAHHLNSGFVMGGKIYCAHSNFPKKPEKSEIIVLDPESMTLTVFKDFGNFGGSLTWCIHQDDAWWCCFAKYGKENGGTFLVKLSDEWKEIGRWTLPAELVSQLGQYSLSGGIWRDGLLVVTGHNDPVVFRLRVPKEGTVLELVDRQKVPFTGQGIAADPVTAGIIGIDRDRKRVLVATSEGKP